MLMVLMFVLCVSLVWAGVNFALARQEIARCNEAVIETCEIMECDISPLGDLDCRSSAIPEDWFSRNPELQTFNFSEWGVRNEST